MALGNPLAMATYEDADYCAAGHPIDEGNGLELPATGKRMCRACRGIANRSYGYEWMNSRGQVFVFVPDHPRSRRDGFYARSRYVVEKAGTMPEGWPDGAARPTMLPAKWRVLHLDGDPSNDALDNLKVFESQHALAQWRSERLREAREA